MTHPHRETRARRNTPSPVEVIPSDDGSRQREEPRRKARRQEDRRQEDQRQEDRQQTEPGRGDAPWLEGLWVALATPFTAAGGVDLPAFRGLVRHAVRGGVDGLLVLGSTGEAATLTDLERDRLMTACLEEADDRPILAGTGSNATATAARWTHRAAELGVRGALVVTPYYNKPNPAGLLAHYRAVSEAAPELPIVLYNVPGRTGTNLSPELLDGLWNLPHVVGLKESSGDLAQIDTILRQAPAGKVVLAGDDGLALPAIALGARGLVSVVGNLFPAETWALVDSALAGRLDEARRRHAELIPLVEALFEETNPVPLKAALAQVGLAGDTVRPPLALASEATRRRLSEVLAVLRGVAA